MIQHLKDERAKDVCRKFEEIYQAQKGGFLAL